MAAAASASSSSSSRPTPEGVLAYVAQLQLQLHDDLVRWRKERMTRQDAALRAYVATLPSGADFPFVRYTHGVTTHSHATDRACVHLDASGIAPYLGVIADRPATRATFLLSYPGVVMTRREYDQMPIAVPTACDTRLGGLVQDEAGPYRDTDFVIVGLPTAHGPNVMSNNNSPFAANVQLVEDEQAVQHVGQQTLVADDYVFVRRTAPIARGDELFTGAYSPDFFATSNTSCDVCFRVDSERNMLRCLDCAIRVHARCRHAEQAEAEEGGRGLPHRCRYHQRLAQIEHEREIFAADIQVDPAVESMRQFVQQKRAHGGRKVRGPFPFEGVYWLRLHDLPAPFRTLKALFDAIRAEDKLRPIAVCVVAMHKCEDEGDCTLVFSEHPPSHFTEPIPSHSPDARLEWLWDAEQAARFLDECDRKAADKRERRRQQR